MTRALPRLLAVVTLVLAAGAAAAIGGGAIGGGAMDRSSATGLRVSGNQLVYGPGAAVPVQLRGVNRSGPEWMCAQGYGIFYSPTPYAPDSAAVIAGMLSWDINAVRVPLNEHCWLGINVKRGLGGAPYRRAVERYVHELTASGLFVIVDLHLAAPSTVSTLTAQLPAADADHAVAFWRSAARAFRGDHRLLFDLYNEPYGMSWSCWLHGCEIPPTRGYPAYRSVGMQQLVDTVRAAGATQPLLIEGPTAALQLTGWWAHRPHDPLHQLVASEHNYAYIAPCDASCRSGLVATSRRAPVVMGEIGDWHCHQSCLMQMLPFADAHGISYLGWAWGVPAHPGPPGCQMAMVARWDGTPTAYGSTFRAHYLALGVPVRP